MAVAVKGTANNSNTTSVTIPTHAVGDCIMLVAYKTSVTAPTKPSAAGTVPAWVTIDTQSGNTNSLIACYFVATANNHTSGTWTGAISMTAIVLTGVSPAVIGGHAGGTNASNLTVTGHAITLTNADGSSLVVDFWGRTATVTAWTALSGYTDQTSTTTATGPVVLSTQNAGTSGAVASHVSTGTATVGANEAVEFVSGPHVADATATAESLGTIPPGPILYEPINTADTVTVQIAGGLSPLTVNVADSTSTASTANTELLVSNVNVADATTTGESVTVSPPGTLTLGVNVTDGTTTGETVGAFEPFNAPVVSDAVTTASTVVTLQDPSGITVSDATATGEVVTVSPPNSSPQVTVTDSTATSEFVVIAFDPPIIFTLEVNVADVTATGEIIGRELDSNVSVTDATATTSTGNTEQIVSFVNVTDATATVSTANFETLVSNVNVTSSVTTGEVVAAVEPTALQVNVADAAATGESVTVSEAGAALPPQLVLTQIASDNFNRANSTLAGSNNWLATLDGSMSISGDEAIGTSGSIEGNYRTNETYDANQYSQATIGSVNNVSASFIGLSVRNSTSGDDCYVAIYFCPSGDPPQLDFYKRTGGGSLTIIAQHSLPVAPLAQGDVITLVAEDEQLTIFVNGVGFASCNDADVTGPGAPGIISFDPVTLDNWQGGNAGTGALPAAIGSDNFNRADGAMSSGQPGWQTLAGSEFTGTIAVDPSIVSDQLVASTGFHAAAIRTESYGSDQWASIQMGGTTLAPASGGFVGILLRVQPDLTSCYLGCVFGHDDPGDGNAAAAPMSYRIFRIDDVAGDGASTFITACATTNDAANVDFDPTGTAYTFVADGNRLSFRVNGAEVMSATDSTYVNGQPGLMNFPPSTADTFSAGDVSSDLDVSVSDSTATNSTGNTELLTSFVKVTDSATTGESVTVSLQAAGGFSINVTDAATTHETVNCTMSTPLVAVTDSTSTHEAVGVQFPITGIFNAPRMCDPTFATLILYSSQEVVKAYATAATLLAYSSTGKIQSYSSGCAVKPYSSGSAVSTYTSRATPVAYQSFATIIPYTSTATPKQCSP